MRRNYCLLALALLFVPCTSYAAQLHWSNNQDTLTFISAKRCTLTIAADPQEQLLPSEWTLVWVADGLSIQPMALGAEAACFGQIAQASALDPPSTAADSLDHRSTAHLCSVDNVVGAPAMYLLDLPGGARAKFKVIALDPADPDSGRVLESVDVTCNGGIPDPYPATVLHATSSHHHGDLSITLIGSGLSATQASPSPPATSPGVTPWIS